MQPAVYFLAKNTVEGELGGVTCRFLEGRTYEVPLDGPVSLLAAVKERIDAGDLLELEPAVALPVLGQQRAKQIERGRNVVRSSAIPAELGAPPAPSEPTASAAVTAPAAAIVATATIEASASSAITAPAAVVVATATVLAEAAAAIGAPAAVVAATVAAVVNAAAAIDAPAASVAATAAAIVDASSAINAPAASVAADVSVDALSADAAATITAPSAVLVAAVDVAQEQAARYGDPAGGRAREPFDLGYYRWRYARQLTAPVVLEELEEVEARELELDNVLVARGNVLGRPISVQLPVLERVEAMTRELVAKREQLVVSLRRRQQRANQRAIMAAVALLMAEGVL